MQDKSEFKCRCGKFERLGDGLQTDAIADDGYTYDFYFRNEPVPKKWLDAGFSARCMPGSSACSRTCSMLGISARWTISLCPSFSLVPFTLSLRRLKDPRRH